MGTRQILCSGSVLGLTVVYASFCVAIYFFLPACLKFDDATECISEGYDNSVLAWTTNFFVGLVFAIIAATLFCCSMRTNSRPLTSGLAFEFLSLSFLCRGIIGLFFPNSGADDGHGQIGFYLLTLVSYTFWTISCVFFLILVRVASDSVSYRESHFGRYEHKVFFGLIVFSFAVVTTACAWNTLALWNISDMSIDNHDKGASANYLPIRLLGSSVLLWQIFYCGFVVTSVNVWRMLATQQYTGVKAANINMLAAFFIIMLQMVNATVVVLLALYNFADRQSLLDDKTAHAIASVVFNFCTLLTGYLMYSFLSTIFPIAREAEKVVETDSDSDNEAGIGALVVQDSALENGEEQDKEGEEILPAEEETSTDVEIQQVEDNWATITKNVQDALSGLFLNTQFETSEQSIEKVSHVAAMADVAEVSDVVEVASGAENAEAPSPKEEGKSISQALEEC